MTLRLPRLPSSNGGFSDAGVPISDAKSPRNGSPVGGSSLMTWAPQSPSMHAADGPATDRPSSTTLIPSSGPYKSPNRQEVAEPVAGTTDYWVG